MCCTDIFVIKLCFPELSPIHLWWNRIYWKVISRLVPLWFSLIEKLSTGSIMILHSWYKVMEHAVLKSLKKFHNTRLRMFCRVKASESKQLGLVQRIIKECSQYHTQNVLKREDCLNLCKLLTWRVTLLWPKDHLYPCYSVCTRAWN